MELAWWVSVIGVPLVGALFAVDFYIHRNSENERDKLAAELANTKAAFNDYRVSSAQLFATVTAVGEVKRELMNSLGRIEDKLDRIADRNERRDQRN